MICTGNLILRIMVLEYFNNSLYFKVISVFFSKIRILPRSLSSPSPFGCTTANIASSYMTRYKRSQGPSNLSASVLLLLFPPLTILQLC